MCDLITGWKLEKQFPEMQKCKAAKEVEPREGSVVVSKAAGRAS